MADPEKKIIEPGQHPSAGRLGFLFSTEEELSIYKRDRPAAAPAAAAERREALRGDLAKAGLPTSAIEQMNARELLAADLIYVNPRTAPHLQRLDGPFSIQKLYDGQNVLEFRFEPMSAADLQANRATFYQEVDRGVRHYDLVERNVPNTHVNFSAWDKDGNIMDPAHPRFATQGARLAQMATNVVYNSKDYATYGERGVMHADVTLGPSRQDTLRHTGVGNEARVEIRLSTNKNVDTLIKTIQEQGLALLASEPGAASSDVAVFDRGFFQASNDGFRATIHALNGSTIASNGRIISNHNYLRLRGDAIGSEIGLVRPEIGDKRPAWHEPLQFEEEWHSKVISKLFDNAKVVDQGGTPRVTFPELRLNDELPLYFDVNKQLNTPGIRAVRDENGNTIVEVSRGLLERQEYFTGADNIAVINERLANISMLGASKTFAFSPAAGPTDAWTVLGSIEYPSVEIELDQMSAPQKYLVSRGIQETFVTPGAGSQIDGQPIYYNEYHDAVLWDKNHEEYRMLSKNDFTRASLVTFNGVHADIFLREHGLVPMEALHRFEPKPIESPSIRAPIPKGIYEPAFSETRNAIRDIVDKSRAHDFEADVGERRETLVGTDMHIKVEPKFKDQMQALGTNPEASKFGINVQPQGEGYLLTMPAGTYEGIQGMASLLRNSNPDTAIPATAETALGRPESQNPVGRRGFWSRLLL